VPGGDVSYEYLWQMRGRRGTGNIPQAGDCVMDFRQRHRTIVLDMGLRSFHCYVFQFQFSVTVIILKNSLVKPHCFAILSGRECLVLERRNGSAPMDAL
jgi:hypothetical protein